jgi:hypothetical protein
MKRMADQPLHPASVELENQLRRLDAIADPASRSTATDLLSAVLQFHTAALERLLQITDESDASGKLLAAFDRDPLVRSVLLIHDLHPDSLHARVRRAMLDLEPTLQRDNASLELVEADDEIVRLQIKGRQPGGRPLIPVVEHAIRTAAPEIAQVIVEEPTSTSTFVPLSTLQNQSQAASGGALQIGD